MLEYLGIAIIKHPTLSKVILIAVIGRQCEIYATAHWFIATQSNIKEQLEFLYLLTLVQLERSPLAYLHILSRSSLVSDSSNFSMLVSKPYATYYDLISNRSTEYPMLRAFAMFPGIAVTNQLETSGKAFRPYAKDHLDIVGMMAL
jgi:hypothetical protein